MRDDVEFFPSIDASIGALSEEMESFVKKFHHVSCATHIPELDSDVIVRFYVGREFSFDGEVYKMVPKGATAKNFFYFESEGFEDHFLDLELENFFVQYKRFKPTAEAKKLIAAFRKCSDYASKLLTLACVLNLEISLKLDRENEKYAEIHPSLFISASKELQIPKILRPLLKDKKKDSSRDTVKLIYKG